MTEFRINKAEISAGPECLKSDLYEMASIMHLTKIASLTIECSNGNKVTIFEEPTKRKGIVTISKQFITYQE